jgi:hypothetical protein
VPAPDRLYRLEEKPQTRIHRIAPGLVVRESTAARGLERKGG